LFSKSKHGYLTSDLVYSQILAVVGGKRFLIGEYQIKAEKENLDPSPGQIATAQRAIDYLNKMAGTEMGK